MYRFFLVLFVSFLTVSIQSAVSDEFSEKTAKKLMTAWWKCDFTTIKANCSLEHPFRQPNMDFQPLIDNINYSKKWVGDLKELKLKQVHVKRNGSKTISFCMFFSKGIYDGGIHLTSKNYFAGAWGPFLEKGKDLPNLNKKQMLEDFDYMVEILHDTMPHAPAIREAFGIDVWKKLSEYRSYIIGNENLPEFARLIQQALAACKGHHLEIIKPWWNITETWYQKYYMQTVPPQTVQISRNISTLLGSLSSPHRPTTIRFLYWNGDYYTAPKFLIDQKLYHGPLKLITVDGKMPKAVEPLLRDNLGNFDYKNKSFFEPNFYISLPSSMPDHRTFLFETFEKKRFSIMIPDNAEVIAKSNRNFFSIPKQVLFFKKYNLVYIRVPSMNSEDLPFYKRELSPILTKEKPRYAVIDIRGNGGGSDSVPITLLCMVSAKAVLFKGILATPANDRTRHYMKQRGWDFSDNKNVKRISFLENRQFDIQEFDMKLESDKNASAEHVYIIAHDIYSAAGTLVALAKANKHVTAVGFPGTKILGMGIDPYYFALPNSQLTISVGPATDLSNCKSATDTLHPSTEIELPMSPETYLAYLYCPVPADCRNYLENEDPFMKKIFTMIQKHENTSRACHKEYTENFD